MALLVACLPIGALAQGGDALRGRALGEVRSTDGEPWPDVEVVLLSRPLPEAPDVGQPDVVRTRTDEHGRYRAGILLGRSYSVCRRPSSSASRSPP